MEPAETVWATWARLRRVFALWRMIGESFVSPGAWGLYGVDMVTGFRRNATTRRTLEITSELSQQDFEAVAALAALNARRQDRWFRLVAVVYLTAPITLIATWGQIAPDDVGAFIRSRGVLSVVYAAAFTLAALAYMIFAWRARQIVDVLDLARVERDARPLTAVELREG